MIDSYITSLQKKPGFPHYKAHLWSDFLELLCLANIDGEISKEDVLDRLAERELDLQEGDADEVLELESLDLEGMAEPAQRYRRHDYWMERIDSWYSVFSSRRNLYGDNYPFRVEGNDLVLHYDSNNLNHKYYVYLLLCSKLSLFDKTTSGAFSSHYELLSFDALSHILPKSFKVILFGSNSRNLDPAYGNGVNCLTKIKNLASELNENLSSNLKESAFPANNYGDEGLDLVAYLDTGDSLSSKLIILGQCACTSKWVEKQSSSSYSNWHNLISLTAMTTNAIFIPFCFRDGDGNWDKPSDIRQTFVIDRFRLIYYLKKSHKFSKDIDDVLDEILKTREPIF